MSDDNIRGGSHLLTSDHYANYEDKTECFQNTLISIFVYFIYFLKAF
jgi:hypothetical protein